MEGGGDHQAGVVCVSAPVAWAVAHRSGTAVRPDTEAGEAAPAVLVLLTKRGGGTSSSGTNTCDSGSRDFQTKGLVPIIPSVQTRGAEVHRLGFGAFVLHFLDTSGCSLLSPNTSAHRKSSLMPSLSRSIQT